MPLLPFAPLRAIHPSSDTVERQKRRGRRGTKSGRRDTETSVLGSGLEPLLLRALRGKLSGLRIQTQHHFPYLFL
jgi:hypothetical protein